MKEKRKALEYFRNQIERNNESILLAESIGDRLTSKRCKEENAKYQIAIEALSFFLKENQR